MRAATVPYTQGLYQVYINSGVRDSVRLRY